MNFPPPSTVPEVEIFDDTLDKAGVRLFVRREDQVHPEISGNKYWKLKYNLLEAVRLNHETILTFGGAYSNHIAATAAACRLLGLKSVGIIRGGEKTENPTLALAAKNGMLLHRVSREEYRQKSSSAFQMQLQLKFGDFYALPEGGTNKLAIKGAMEMASRFQVNFDFLAIPVGTGGSLAGCIQAFEGRKEILGFSALRGSFLQQQLVDLLQSHGLPVFDKWKIITDYHFGGFAKEKPELLHFIRNFGAKHAIPLEQVYTGKMVYGLFDMIQNNVFPVGSTILALHTGGLQGRSWLLKNESLSA